MWLLIVGWLLGCLTGLFGLLVGWLVGRSVVVFVCWLVGKLVGRYVAWLVGMYVCFFCWLVNWLVGWLVGRLVGSLGSRSVVWWVGSFVAVGRSVGW